MNEKYEQYRRNGGTRTLEDLQLTVRNNLPMYAPGTTEEQALDWLLNSLLFNTTTSLNSMLESVDPL
jgi:hypothetical protein